MIISHLKKEKTLKDSGCCVVFLGGMMPVKLTFYSYPILFSCKWDGWEQGGGMHQSIQPSISFPLRGLDSSGGTEVIRLQIIPHIQQKALQTAKQGINLSCRLKLIHKISSSTSCLLCGTFPKTPEASPPLLSQWTQLPLSNMAFVVRNNVEGGQHSSAILAWRSNFHTWCASWKPSFSLFYFLFPLLSTPQNQSGTQTGERFLANAMSSNTLSLRISLSQMQMCCIISLASRLFRLEKCVLINVGNSKKEVSEKVRLNQTKKPAHIVVSRSRLLNKEGVKLLTIDVIKNTWSKVYKECAKCSWRASPGLLGEQTYLYSLIWCPGCLCCCSI